MSSRGRPVSIAIVTLLVLMVASTFIGVPLNGGDKGWIHVYDGELQLFANTIVGPSPAWRNILFCIQAITHVALLFLLVLTNYKNFFSLLIGIPLLYLMLQAATFFYFLILLIPFMVLWILTIVAWKQRKL